jgi:hypothetical protein
MIEQGLPGGVLPGSCKLNQVLQLRIGRLWPHKETPFMAGIVRIQAILSGFPVFVVGYLAVRQSRPKGARKLF